jgi:RNA polymerase sigma factor (sigma-70 family)
MFSKFQMEQHVRSSPGLNLRQTEVDDGTLWQRFKNGNDLAFSMLYSKYVQRLFNYGMNSCYERELVLDCLQELFGKLWETRGKLGDVQAVNFYLFKSFRRLLIGKLVQKRKYPFVGIPKNEVGFEINQSIEDSWIMEEASAQQITELKKAIDSLTKRQREVIFLRFYNDLSYSQVAAIMEMSIDSVYNLISKAIDTLRKVLKNAYLCLPFLWSFFDK